MKSVNFLTGTRSYAINGDENNVICVNVSDVNIVKRMDEGKLKLEKIQEEWKTVGKPTPAQLCEFDKRIREIIDYTFDADVSSHAFGKTNCLSPLKNGKMLCTEFLEAFFALVMQDMKSIKRENGATELEKKIEDYTAFEEEEESFDISGLSPRQKAYLRSLQ